MDVYVLVFGFGGLSYVLLCFIWLVFGGGVFGFWCLLFFFGLCDCGLLLAVRVFAGCGLVCDLILLFWVLIAVGWVLLALVSVCVAVWCWFDIVWGCLLG